MPTAPHVRDVSSAEFAEAVIQQSHRQPVLVDFWAAWCGPCRALGPILERLAAEFEGGFLLVKVDTDREQSLAAQYQIRSLPTVMLFREGRAVTQFAGALPEGQIRRLLSEQQVVATSERITWADEPAERMVQVRAALAEHPDRPALLLEQAVTALQCAADAESRAESRRLLEALPASVYSDARAVRARGQLELTTIADSTLANSPVHKGVALLLADRTADGLETLLEALREDRGEESSARRALVQALATVADEELVRATRRRMAALLF
jgi:putative thioredoxin